MGVRYLGMVVGDFALSEGLMNANMRQRVLDAVLDVVLLVSFWWQLHRT